MCILVLFEKLSRDSVASSDRLIGCQRRGGGDIKEEQTTTTKREDVNKMKDTQ